MSRTSKIEDVGQKLGGARKDASETGRESHHKTTSITLEDIWPAPNDWRSLIPAIGADRASMCMVIHANLAPQSFTHRAIVFDEVQMKMLYAQGIRVLKWLFLERLDLDRAGVKNAFIEHMHAFAIAKFPGLPLAKLELAYYAVGKPHKRSVHHPFSFTPINAMRYNYLARMGWGTDERVLDSHAYGPLSITYTRGSKQGQKCWRAVKAVAGAWQYLEQTDFESEEVALARALAHFHAKLDADAFAKSKPTTQEKPDWVRPLANLESLREGFAQASQNRSAQDLVDAYGFRGVEFGNWVSQAQRQWFVDSAADAFADLMALLGMPLEGSSLFGKLGLGYGSRGEGLKRTAAHFEPSSWVISLTKTNGPGCIAHEMGHALDAYFAAMIWGQKIGHKKFASEMRDQWKYPSQHALSSILDQWDAMVHGHCVNWIAASRALDHSRSVPYWSSRCELFARGFEVMVGEALRQKGRRNSMLVHGVLEQDFLGKERNPYPMGQERVLVCTQMAQIIRCFKANMKSTSQRH